MTNTLSASKFERHLTLNDWSRGEQSVSDLLYSKPKQKQILKNALRSQRQHQATSDHVQQRPTFREEQ